MDEKKGTKMIADCPSYVDPLDLEEETSKVEDPESREDKKVQER